MVRLMRADSALPAWAAPNVLPPWAVDVMGRPELPNASDRNICIAALTRLEFFDEQPAAETLVLPGLVGSSSDTLLATNAVNTAKDALKDSVLTLRRLNIDIDRDPALNAALQQELTARPPLVNEALRRYGLRRLALKQCYRHIPVLSARPKSLRWTWARTRAITRITVSQAEQMLSQLGDGLHIQRQLLRLTELPKSEVLAQVQDCAPHLRANVVYETPLGATRAVRQMINAPLPVLFPAEPGEPLPLGWEDFKLSVDRNEKPNRKRRNDQRLDPEPFLPAIRVHRYMRE